MRSDIHIIDMRMSAVTLYARDLHLWAVARKAAGNQGLSSLVEQALRKHLQEPEHDCERRFVLPVCVADGGQENDEMAHSIEFHGGLVTDSSGFSVEQLPRIRVYRTAAGRLVVYRTWPSVFGLPPTFAVYGDFRSLESDPHALATTWITEQDPLGERSDLTPDLRHSLKRALARQTALSIDGLEPSQLGPGNYQPVRLGRDTKRIARALVGTADLDVLLECMHLLGSTASDPKHLSEIENAFRELKPVSRLGNAPEDLKELQAAMRGYLNNDSRKRAPSQRLFVNPKRGFWGVSPIGDRRAVEVLRRLGMVRG
jgi:hypothetical protein